MAEVTGAVALRPAPGLARDRFYRECRTRPPAPCTPHITHDNVLYHETPERGTSGIVPVTQFRVRPLLVAALFTFQGRTSACRRWALQPAVPLSATSGR